jgi:hypothetical protein
MDLEVPGGSTRGQRVQNQAGGDETDRSSEHLHQEAGFIDGIRGRD